MAIWYDDVMKMYFCGRYEVLSSFFELCHSQVSFRPLEGQLDPQAQAWEKRTYE